MKNSLNKIGYLLEFGAIVFTISFTYAQDESSSNLDIAADCNSNNCPGSGKACCKDNDKNSTFYKS